MASTDPNQNTSYNYPLPNDSPEAKRLDTQHELFHLTFDGKLYFAPVSLDEPQSRILDLGCGTSSWAIEVAGKHPSATVIGIDLGQPQPSNKPTNYTYIQANFEKPWPFDESDTRQNFDFMHHRFVFIGLRNAKEYIAQAWRHLKPGGYFEIQDFELPFRTTTPKYTQYVCDLDHSQRTVGIDMQAANKWDDWLAEAGFVDINHEYIDWTLGVPEGDGTFDHGDERLCQVSELALENMITGLKGFCKLGYLNVHGWTEEKLDVWIEEVREELRRNPGKNAMPLHVIYGRKPEA